jgi:hypothetical protein
VTDETWGTSPIDRLHVATPLGPCIAEHVERTLDGFSLIAPGRESPPKWRPDRLSDPGFDTAWNDAGVGRVGVSTNLNGDRGRQPAGWVPASTRAGRP